MSYGPRRGKAAEGRRTPRRKAYKVGMSKMVTNRELMVRCYSATQQAADKVSSLEVAGVAGLTPAAVERVRKLLREALCAAQELKFRLKQENKTNRRETAITEREK